jgi:hypothetical protein
MKQDTKAHDTVEDLKSDRSHQVEDVIHGLWVVLFSEDSFSKESRNKLVECYKKIQFLSKKKNLQKQIKKEKKKK